MISRWYLRICMVYRPCRGARYVAMDVLILSVWFALLQARRAQGCRLRKATLEGDWSMVISLLTKNISRQHHKQFIYAVYRQVRKHYTKNGRHFLCILFPPTHPPLSSADMTITLDFSNRSRSRIRGQFTYVMKTFHSKPVPYTRHCVHCLPCVRLALS